MEVNPNTHFTRKEVFMGEEIEAIYLKARKPLADIDGIDLSASDDPMLRMGHVSALPSISALMRPLPASSASRIWKSFCVTAARSTATSSVPPTAPRRSLSSSLGPGSASAPVTA